MPIITRAPKCIEIIQYYPSDSIIRDPIKWCQLFPNWRENSNSFWVSYVNKLEQGSLITSLMNQMTGLHIENKQTDMQTERIEEKSQSDNI
jgi:hypothetical protein